MIGHTIRRDAVFSTTVLLALGMAATPIRAADEQMTITGRLLGPDDKPVAGGQVAVVVSQQRRSERPSGSSFGPAGLSSAFKLLGTATTDQTGRFCLSGPRYSASSPYGPLATLFAAAPGYGLSVRLVDPARLRQDVTVQLLPELVVRGRLIDLQGQPAAGVKIHYVGSAEDWRIREPQCVPPLWPKPITTDDKGRFLLRGLGVRKATLEVRHERLAPQRLEVDAAKLEEGKEASLSVVGARNLRGRVTYADTGKPAANMRVLAVALEDSYRLGGPNHVEGRTDEQGRFVLNTYPGNSQALIVDPPAGTPYQRLRQMIPWARAAREQVDVTLPRGILVHGVLTERPSGKPVAGARVQFRPRENNNPFYRREVTGGEEEYYETAISDTDGRFQLCVLPGPGHLFALGPTLDYVPVETSRGQLEYGKPGGRRYYPDALVALDIKPGTEMHEVNVELRRGVTLQGRVVGPDDKPVDSFVGLCRHYRPTGFSWWQQRYNLLEGRDGQFELPGCDPERPFTVWLVAPDAGLGATAELSAKQAAGQPVTVRLERCGSAVARFADQDGKPLVKYYPFFSIVITPGIYDPGYFIDYDDKKPLEADGLIVPYWIGIPAYWRQDALHRSRMTDAEGHITFTNLIPGATYRIMTPNIATSKGRWDELAVKGFPFKDFTVKPGEKLVIPEVLHDRKAEVRFVQ